MSNETNKYTFLRIKKDTHKMIKIASAQKGSKNMDEYVKELLKNDFKKPISKEEKKKKGGFSLGF